MAGDGRVIHRLLCAALVVVLAGCGSQRDLRPLAGASLPPAPYGRGDQPTPAELLEPSPQAIPARSEELLRQSEERQDDPFDLPREG